MRWNDWHKMSAMRIRSKRRADMICSKMTLNKDTRILEIGCGGGLISYFIAEKTNVEILATDISLSSIELARNTYKRSNLKFEVLDFNKPGDFQGKKFDYIVGNGILHHLYYNLDFALSTIHSLLKSNGKLIFLEPNLINPYCYLIFSFPYFRKLTNLDPDEMAFTRRFIKKKLEKTSFSNNTITYKDFLVPITPKFLIKPLIFMGDIVEKIPLLNRMTQSIFITACK